MRGDRLPLDLAACIGFYTRLPVPAALHRADGFASAQWAAPLAGALVGLFVGGTLVVAGLAGLPAPFAAALALGLGMLVTGALHEDGVADVADGFGGGRSRDNKLAIMKDSRIGSYGALALIMTVLARWSALVALGQAEGAAILAATIAAHAASRALLPAFMASVAPARPGGLSAGIGHVAPVTAFAALFFGAAGLWLGGPAIALVSATLLAVWFAGLALLCRAQIGGQTGDVLGTLQQGGEIVVLAVFSATNA